VTPDSTGRFNLSAAVLRHREITLFFILAVAIGGTLAFLNLGQREDPDFAFRVMVIRTLWPGASSEQVSRQVTDRIEKKLQEMPYYRHTISYSKPGESLIILELLDSSPSKEVPQLWYQARKKLGDIHSELPPEVAGPFFNDEFGDVFGSIFAFTADGYTLTELKDYVEDVRQELQRLPNIAKIALVGVQEDRIFVEMSHRKLASLGLLPEHIAQALAGQNAITLAGSVETPDNSVRLQVTGELETVEAVSALPLRVGGQTLRLGDIARVYRGYADPPVYTMRFKGRPAIGLAVAMKTDGDVLELGKDLQRETARLRQDLPLGIEFEQVSNQPGVVKLAVGEFLRALAEAVAIVLLVSFLTLGLRTGLVVALTIPLVLAATFLLMRYFGIALHRVSTGALIIALGLLVDDAIIAVEMMARKIEEGWGKAKAATFAYSSTAFPMLTGTLVTAVGFLPIATARSTTGEYTFAIFAVVTIALVMSWFAAVIVTPFFGALILKKRADHGPGPAPSVYETPFYQRLRALIEWCITHRKTVLVITAGVFALGVAGMNLTEKQFFPSSNRLEINVELWLPEGASYQASETQAKKLETVLAQDPDIEQFATYVGNGSPRFFLSFDQQLFRPNFAQVIVLTHDLQARERVVERLRKLFQDDFAGIRTRVIRVPLGPPVSWPIQFRVMGEDSARLKAIADDVLHVVQASPNALNVNIDWGNRTPMLRVNVDQDKVRALGVSTTSVSRALQAAVSGLPLAQYRENERLIQIVLRAPEAERNLLSAVKDINVPTASGRYVPLSQVARVEETFEEPIIWRRDRLPAMTVRADIVDGVQAPDVASAIDKQLQDIRGKLPFGYRIEVGGAHEENTKAQNSIIVGMPMMLAIVLGLLILQLQSFSLMAMVLATAPLGIVGVALALLVFNKPFGFVAMLGTIALGGMIMRNTVILVDQIQQDIRSGHPTWVAIREATVRRFRPISLTAAASILAMIPLTRSVLWGPMAFAIMGGLIVATALTVFAVPALYAAWFRVVKPAGS